MNDLETMLLFTSSNYLSSLCNILSFYTVIFPSERDDIIDIVIFL